VSNVIDSERPPGPRTAGNRHRESRCRCFHPEKELQSQPDLRPPIPFRKAVLQLQRPLRRSVAIPGRRDVGRPASRHRLFAPQVPSSGPFLSRSIVSLHGRDRTLWIVRSENLWTARLTLRRSWANSRARGSNKSQRCHSTPVGAIGLNTCSEQMCWFKAQLGVSELACTEAVHPGRAATTTSFYDFPGLIHSWRRTSSKQGSVIGMVSAKPLEFLSIFVRVTISARSCPLAVSPTWSVIRTGAGTSPWPWPTPTAAPFPVYLKCLLGTAAGLSTTGIWTVGGKNITSLPR
jgi:hypothetical protein